MNMRGLSTFISEVRKSSTKRDEQKRIDKELAKIRGKFKNGKIKGYERKKYVCKLVYIYMLGYDVDFGHMEAVHLLSSEKYSEKHIGYLACTLLLNEEHELVTLITNSIRRDLNRRQKPNDQCLALTAISNIAGKEQAEALASDVQAVLMRNETKLIVKKKAAISLLRLFRKYPEIIPLDSWGTRINSLLNCRDLGVMTSVMSLLLGFVQVQPQIFQKCVPIVIQNLGKLVLKKEFSHNYNHYQIPAPWLQVKMLRFLQYFKPPTKNGELQYVIKIIHHIISLTERIKNVERGKTMAKINSAHSILFEAFNLAISYDCNENMLLSCSQKLSKYLGDKDPNLRYLALDTMSRLAYTKIKSVRDSLRKNQKIILLALKDNDISIRRRALELLYSLCNKSNASQIVGELLSYLPTSSYELREELVLKIAILAEKFAVDFTWYVDVILNLISTSGDFVSEDIWHRVIRIITDRDEELKKYSAITVCNTISSHAVHENAIKVAAYILGEHGDLIADNQQTSALKQFNLLYKKFNICSIQTKSILLSAFIKFYVLYEDDYIRSKIKKLFFELRQFMNPEIQQRANEYYQLTQKSYDELVENVFIPLPPYPQNKEDSFLKKIMDKQKSTRAIKKEIKEEKEEEEEDEDDKIQIDENKILDKQPPKPTPKTLKKEEKKEEKTGNLLELDQFFTSDNNNNNNNQQQQQQQQINNNNNNQQQVPAGPLDLDDLFSGSVDIGGGIQTQQTQQQQQQSIFETNNNNNNQNDNNIFGNYPNPNISTLPKTQNYPQIDENSTKNQTKSPSAGELFESMFQPQPQIQNQVENKKNENEEDIFSSSLTVPENKPKKINNNTSFAEQSANIALSMKKKRELSGISIDESLNSKNFNEDENVDGEYIVSSAVQKFAEEQFSNLLVKDGGTLIEDKNLKVTISSKFHQFKGRIQIDYQNKTMSPIEQIRIKTNQNGNSNGLSFNSSQIAPFISPNSTISQMITLSCSGPFDVVIQFSLYFKIDKKNMKFQFKLPIDVHRFIDPLKISSPQEFFAKWKTIQKQSKLEIQNVIYPQNGVNLSKCKDTLQLNLGLELLNVDSNPNNIVASGSFYFGEGANQNMFVLVRLESKNNAYRLTIRSQNEIITKKVYQLIEKQIH